MITIIITTIALVFLTYMTMISNVQAQDANETSKIAITIYKPDINPNSDNTSYDDPFNVPTVCKITYFQGS